MTKIILNEFSKHNNIDFACPTQQFYDNLQEGKKEQSRNNLNFIVYYKFFNYVKKKLNA